MFLFVSQVVDVGAEVGGGGGGVMEEEDPHVLR